MTPSSLSLKMKCLNGDRTFIARLADPGRVSMTHFNWLLIQPPKQPFVGTLTCPGERIDVPKVKLFPAECLRVALYIIADGIRFYLGPRTAEMVFDH